MIQLVRTTSLNFALIRLNILDKMTNTDYRPLMTLTSQLTGNSKTFIVASFFNLWEDRYAQLLVYIQPSAVGENFLTGSIYVGNTGFPLGFYDATIYQNTSETNLDPTGLTTLYTGLANLTSNSTTHPVTYTEYTTNDSNTESVYITNPTQ
jgi:hypothetical protein